MLLNDVVGKKYGCKFSKKLNPVAIEYYMTHAQRGPSCHFFLEKMVRDDDYTLDGDELDYLNGHAVDSYSELFEAFLYAAHRESVKGAKMRINEVVSSYYGCKFPHRLTKKAIEHYRENSREAKAMFILDDMIRTNDYTVENDTLRYIVEEIPDALPELFAAYLYAAAEDVRANPSKGRSIVVMID